MKITVVGLGYVGMSMSVLMGRKYDVHAIDIDSKRVDDVNKLVSTVKDNLISDVLQNEKTRITATLSKRNAYQNANYIVICAPTNFDDKTNKFDLSTIEEIIKDILKINKDAFIVIKSTMSVGSTKYLQKKFKTKKIFYSPEFLREGKALEDNFYPSRIIVGSKDNEAINFGKILISCAKKKDVSFLSMDSSEAEAVKLFANTYLAMRVAFFNELDTFCLSNDLDAFNIINGISLDERIGSHYNNPSFGYGGYCLPKDTKGLLSNFNDIPQSLIGSIVESNSIRKFFLSEHINSLAIKNIGIYRLSMKEGSDNYRSSAVLDIIDNLKDHSKKITIYEPNHPEGQIYGCNNIHDLNLFKKSCDLIICNRKNDELDDIEEKIFSRDIYRID
jgi:UDPglucose 6-dehydrogenase